MSTQVRPVESQTEQYSLLGKEDVSTDAKSKKSAGAFRTISEVADSLGVQQHVLRFWETKFTQVKPLKRGGGRRYYRPEDVALLEKIHHLLYTEGYTIKGVQKLLREVGKAQILQGAVARPAAGVIVAQPVQQQAAAQQAPKSQPVQQQPQPGKFTPSQRAALESVLSELLELRSLVRADS